METGPSTARRFPGRRVMAAMVLLAASLSLSMSVPQAAQALPESAAVVAAGGFHTCAVLSATGYCWGDNSYGELGDGSTVNASAPVVVHTGGGLADGTVAAISSGAYFSCALDTAGAAYCWGDNGDGQLGDDSETSSPVPVPVYTDGVLAGKKLTQISTGYDQACALDSTGTAYCWGNGPNGELGDDADNSSEVPVAVYTGGALANEKLAQVSVGTDHTCAIDLAGHAYCWGLNTDGELGSTTGNSDVPVPVDTSGALSGQALNQISSGNFYTCGTGANGAAYCWGFGSYGQLGDGETSDSYVPVAVDTGGVLNGKTLTQVSAGAGFTCALDTGGDAYCWGGGGDGELGDGGTAGSAVPVAVTTAGVLSGASLTEISTGAYHACGLSSVGAVYCWGLNGYGELGDDGTASSDVPVPTGPSAPIAINAIGGNGTAAVSWAAPSLVGGTLTGYTATATPGGETCPATAATTCTITGLTNGAAYSITVIAHSSAGDSAASESVSVTPYAGGGLAFTSVAEDTAKYGTAFSFTVTTSGAPVPALSKRGTLPAGVTFTGSKNGTATIAGTPRGAASGLYTVTITAKNKQTAVTQSFTLTVTRPPAIKAISAPRATAGTPFAMSIAATGYPSPVLSESGPLPTGISFTDNGDGTASVAGTPATGSGGRYPITITGTNTSGTASRIVTLTVK